MEKVSGKRPEQLNGLDDVPKELVYLWRWSTDIGEFDWERVYGWSKMRNVHLSQWELDALMHLDRIKHSG